MPGALVALLAALPAASPPVVTAAEEYLLVFGSDSVPYHPARTHTCAALVRVESAPGCSPRVTDLRSISWLPVTMKLRPLVVRPEPGRNVPMDETIRFYLASGNRICVWGPYRVRPELAEAFRLRLATLEGGGVRFKTSCRLYPPDVLDCARAVEEMTDPDARRRYIGLFGYGAASASASVQKFSPWLIEPERTHPWVATLIGLDEYPLVRRRYGDFTSRRDQLRGMIRRE